MINKKIMFCPDIGITTFFLDNKDNRPCVLVCPGGGYRNISPREAEPVALQFNAAGYHAAVLNYRVYPNKHPDPITDLAMAMMTLRQSEYNIGPIIVCGFSAGGHLAATLGVHWDKPFLKESLMQQYNRDSSSELLRPDALILCYAVISVQPEYVNRSSFDALTGGAEYLLDFLSLDKHVTKTTPPTFLWHTSDDAVVPVENSMLFGMALRKHNIPFEMHIYPKGKHGLSLATSEMNELADPHIATWMSLCREWLSICLYNFKTI